jgi:hypothetical protein
VMIRAYRFLFSDMHSDEDMIAGNARPWRIGERRCYHPIQIDAGEETVTQLGYRSSPTLWSALLHADGPVVCLVEVSEPIVIERTRFGTLQVSRERRLLNAYDASAELRLFACDCASRVLQLYECENRNAGLRTAIETARRFARGECSMSELKISLCSAREAAEASTGKARVAAVAAMCAAFDEASDAAIAAGWGASWAAGRAERERQYRRFKSLSRSFFQA